MKGHKGDCQNFEFDSFLNWKPVEINEVMKLHDHIYLTCE